MTTKKEAKAFVIPESFTTNPVYKVEHWQGPYDYSDKWRRTYYSLHETMTAARIDLNNTRTTGEHFRVLFVMCNNKWVEITRILDEYCDETR